MLTVAFALAACAIAAAQADVTFAWDVSDSAAGAPANNPVRYRLYSCADQALTQCAPNEAGTALEHKLTLAGGVYYILARAYWNALTVDGNPTGDALESGNSNVLKVEVHVPPGNPKNTRVRVTTVAESETGQAVQMKRLGD